MRKVINRADSAKNIALESADSTNSVNAIDSACCGTNSADSANSIDSSDYGCCGNLDSADSLNAINSACCGVDSANLNSASATSATLVDLNIHESRSVKNPSFWEYFKQKYLITFYKPLPAVIALGILATYYFGFFGSVWAVTGEMTRWGGEILELFGADLSKYEYYNLTNLNGSPLTRNDGIMLIGMFLGCFIAALWANNVKLRFPASKIRVAQALIGGILSGFGARLAMGCNLANFFTGLPYFSLHTWVFVVFMIIGIYLGIKVINLPFMHSKAKLQKATKSHNLHQEQDRAKFLFYLGSVIFVACIVWIAYLTITGTPQQNKAIPLLGLALGFGLAFGFLISRAQICFTSAFRDLFLTGRSEMAKAVFIGIMISSLGAFSYIMLGNGIKMVWIGPNVVLGGFLFGFGIVLAGGCECGWIYRAVEGQVHYWIAGVGNIIGTIILALTWDIYAPSIAYPYPKLNLLGVFGNYGGLVVNYVLLLAMLGLIIMYSRYFFKAKKQAIYLKCA